MMQVEGWCVYQNSMGRNGVVCIPECAGVGEGGGGGGGVYPRMQ